MNFLSRCGKISILDSSFENYNRIISNSYNVNHRRLNRFVKRVRRSDPSYFNDVSDKEILEYFNILQDDHLSLTGNLVFSLTPQLDYPNLGVYAYRFPDSNEKISKSYSFIDFEIMTGAIPEMIQKTVEFVKRKTQREWILNSNDFYTDNYEYPIKAVEEIITNALIHRDYSETSLETPVYLKIFSNRIEVTNPGGLVDNSTIAEVGKKVLPTRNDDLLTILDLLGKINNRSSGIPMIRKEVQAFDLSNPIFENTDTSFKSILKRY